MMKSKKGFTLVELCVVLALVSIVVTMVTGFLTVYHKNVAELKSKSVTMSDINNLRTQIKAWLDDYDNVDYEITVGANSISAKESLSEPESVLGISGKKLKITGEKQREITFESIDHCDFKFDETDSAGNNSCVLRCRIYLNDSSFQELAFSLQADLIKIYAS